ncbi:AAA-type ATPase N-terminal domain [Arabidopsis suecica]|uniref:AAA-type ATPase N-terminal domain n=1 Tax=Arabidopsis suecica TaxID=45249 RepID=A0A8T2FBZ1_ARASU|nr:AAA-type ATPase N-terminal domain [Arabidopsis suecica]
MFEAGGLFGFTGTTMASLMFFWSMYRQFVPYQIRDYLEKCFYKMFGLVSNSVHIKFTEYTEDKGLKKSQAYDLIRNYLSSKSTARAQRLKANESKNSKSLVLSLDDHEAVEDVFQGVKVVWSLSVWKSNDQADSSEKRYLTLSFHNRYREMITTIYLDHVLREGKEIGLKNRERKLYTNNSSQDYSAWREGRWSNVPFDHPATFETLAMDLEKKEGIKKDLLKFTKGKDYYRKVGKPWKRGYLLFGPPGTGKSTMISAMANFLEYDVYDLELTTVKDNSELKKLMLDTKGKSIVVIEDIDCSLDLTGQRKKKKEEDEDEEEEEKKKEAEKLLKRERGERESKVTLSGLLNAIDGLWSACSGEKIIVFTTNYLDKLDPALIRRGRMDNHIEMSYCRFEAFKVLAKNYLEIESHDLFGEIKRLVEETDMSPADVAENLMPKSDEDDADICLTRLVKSLEEEKEKAKKLAEEEKMKKAARDARRIKKKAEEEHKKKNKAEENGDVSHDNGNYIGALM